jgi:hypothetical protein
LAATGFGLAYLSSVGVAASTNMVNNQEDYFGLTTARTLAAVRF